MSLPDEEYRKLSDFRFLLRGFLAFSECRAAEFGLTPQQHQGLLAIRGEGEDVTVGWLANRLLIRPNSASGLVQRLMEMNLVEIRADGRDRRRHSLRLTAQARSVLESLAEAHRDELRRIGPMVNAALVRLGSTAAALTGSQ